MTYRVGDSVDRALKRVKEIEREQRALEDEKDTLLRQAIDDALEDVGLEPVEDAEFSGHRCDYPGNAFGWCVYDQDVDPSHNNCLFCEEPEDRR